jgi:regulator of sirC expression with transglutaminase-like and TPR domain
MLIPLLAARLVAGDVASERSVEQIAEASRGAVVLISSSDRGGEKRGAGSGFIVRSDGWVVTNLHVIGEWRPFVVTLADGTVAKPTAILGVDREHDLALFQIDGKDLPTLELGDSGAVRPGQVVLAVGNPLGLGLSVTRGVIAEQREIEGRRFIQVAMPIEPGSSGSPLIDLEGKAVGVIASKSGASTAFAQPINYLKQLIAKPHPQPMSRWLTIGTSRLWRPILGGNWRQETGRIVASGVGDGFAGRMLYLSETVPPEGTFEVGVEVRLEDESGAAGLAFHSDGNNKHYGFYPTHGNLRMTRFEGPDVFSWSILETVPGEHYRPGEWNAIKVRVAGHKLTGFVNDEIVIEVEDSGLTSGKFGLVKFRTPDAQFRKFRVAPSLPPVRVPESTALEVLRIVAEIANGANPRPETVEALASLGENGLRALRDHVASLKRQAVREQDLVEQVHEHMVRSELVKVLSAPEDEIDLLRSALLLSRLDNPDVEVEPYLQLMERMAREVRENLEASTKKIDKLVSYLFDDLGFRGSQGMEYYDRSNSYINEVLDDREGIPITLSVVFIEVARRVGLKVVGLGIPRHFIVEYRPPGAERQLIDVYDGGKFITREQAEELSQSPLDEEALRASSGRDIILRMLRNLGGVAALEQDARGVLRYLDTMFALGGGSGQERLMRARVRIELGMLEEAAVDLDWLSEHPDSGIDRATVEYLRALLRGRPRGQ